MPNNEYKWRMDQIHPDEELLRTILKTAEEKAKTKKHTAQFIRRPVLAVLTVFLCLFMIVPILGANVETVYQMMFRVAPEMAQLFQPVRRSAECNGIRMTVLSSYIHDNMAEIFVTMQDLTGDRIDETTDLYDSYSINRPFDSSATCELVGFEKKTKTATFLISITEWGNQKVEGKKITFSVKEFLSHKKDYKDITVSLDSQNTNIRPSTQKVFLTGGGGKGYEKSETDGKTETLKPTAEGVKLSSAGVPIEGVTLTAMGYVDQKLHVQVAMEDRLKKDSHGTFYLKDRNGGKVDCDYNMYFTNQYTEPKDRIDYCEYAFDVPEKEIENYRLYGDFVTSGMLTEGDWKVTFPLMKEKGEHK